jgi:hypothetical protein
MSAGVADPPGTGLPETRDRDGAFPRLDEEQRERFRRLGRVRAVEPGELLFAAGDDRSPFFVIESGSVAIVQGSVRGRIWGPRLETPATQLAVSCVGE